MIPITMLMRVGILGVALMVGWGTLGRAGESQRMPVRQYAGQVQSVKIDCCGLQAGTCEGSIVLKLQDGKEVALAIQRPRERARWGRAPGSEH